MTNEQMKANRFARWAKARAKVAFIRRHLEAGHEVQVVTQTRCVSYKAAHIEMFKANKSGAWVQRGKAWDCIDFATVRAVG